MSPPRPLYFAAPENGGLTKQMLAAWHRDGFLILTSFFSQETAEALRRQTASLIQSLKQLDQSGTFAADGGTRTADPYFLDSADKIRLFYESDGVAVNKVGHALHDLDPVFAAFSRQATVEALVSGLGLDNPGLLQSMILVKAPERGTPVVWHQDETFLYTDPPSTLGLWFAIDDADLANGCLWAAPGHHRGPLRQRLCRDDRNGTTTLQMYDLDRTEWPASDALPLEAPSGSVIALHGNLPHYSPANRSPRPRLAYGLHLVNRRFNYPATNWLQRSSENPLRGFTEE